MDTQPIFVFPRWSNTVTLWVIVFVLVLPVYAGALVGYALDPVTLNVGYAPTQPVPYSHALHAGQLGIDCRYCHNTVEKTDFAALPPAETCMNCHKAIRAVSDKMAPVREAWLTGAPLKWKKVNDVPDYVYFNHAAHVNASISCVECHGNVNHMEVVAQVQPMNMAWCLQCHRDPDKYIRPRDEVTNLDWNPGLAWQPEYITGHLSTVQVFARLPDEELLKRAQAVGAPVTDPKGRDVTAQMKGIKLNDDFKMNIAVAYMGRLHATESDDAIRREIGKLLRAEYHVNPNTDCVTCHR